MSAQEPNQDPARSVRNAGDQTIANYADWMVTNAASHLLRTAKKSGITARLRERQHTLDELCEQLKLDAETTALVLDCLISIGFVEQYGDDFALARAGHLLCEHDMDLGDAIWESLPARLANIDVAEVHQNDEMPQGPSSGSMATSNYRSRVASTQWIHTSAAMQAAEMLDDGTPVQSVLDVGCGAAVWSCAYCHRKPDVATVVAVDEESVLPIARKTVESIELGSRYKWVTLEPREFAQATLEDAPFDIAFLPQVLTGYSDSDAEKLLTATRQSIRPGGKVVIPDAYVGPGGAGLDELTARLVIRLLTNSGRVRDLKSFQQMLVDSGFEKIQFSFLAASRGGLGIVVASVPE
ncbi:MAG: class I SAM-dependent methyltransferase [Planctomycetota bacterium]